MTVENNMFTIKTKRTDHPSAIKYPGRPSMEMGRALTQFLSDVGPTNTSDVMYGTYVFEEDVTAEFFDAIQVDDIIGLGVVKGFNEFGENKQNRACAYKFKILEVNKDKDTIKARNVTFEDLKGKSRSSAIREYRGTEVELTFEDISVAIGMGFADVLERDGKLFGVSEEIEMKVKIVDTNKPAEDNASTPAPEHGVSSAVEAPTVDSSNNTGETTTEITNAL